MNIETTELGALLIVIIMAVVTIITRWGGIYLMSYISISNRVQRFVAAMSGSVLVAIVAPMFVRGDLGAQVALLATTIGILVFKRPLLAIGIGIAMAALVRNM